MEINIWMQWYVNVFSSVYNIYLNVTAINILNVLPLSSQLYSSCTVENIVIINQLCRHNTGQAYHHAITHYCFFSVQNSVNLQMNSGTLLSMILLGIVIILGRQVCYFLPSMHIQHFKIIFRHEALHIFSKHIRYCC